MPVVAMLGVCRKSSRLARLASQSNDGFSQGENLSQKVRWRATENGIYTNPGSLHLTMRECTPTYMHATHTTHTCVQHIHRHTYNETE